MTTKNSYRLINPYIEGSLDTVVKARNSFNAGKKLYNSISSYFTNHVEDFYMTIQNVETKDLTHFKIGEKRGNNGTVDFNLVKLDNSFPQEIDNKLTASVEKLGKQSGGKHNDDSPTETTTEESDFFKYPQQPITRFVYFMLPYYKLNVVALPRIDIARIFMPMFSLPINPVLEIRFDLYRYTF